MTFFSSLGLAHGAIHGPRKPRSINCVSVLQAVSPDVSPEPRLELIILFSSFEATDIRKR